MKIMKGDKERYCWVVWEFDDECYLDGKLCSPTVYADSLKNLIRVKFCHPRETGCCGKGKMAKNIMLKRVQSGKNEIALLLARNDRREKK
jgi:hypothetical protein